jgi:hypothetical protein
MCFLWGTNWILIYYLEEIRSLKGQSLLIHTTVSVSFEYNPKYYDQERSIYANERAHGSCILLSILTCGFPRFDLRRWSMTVDITSIISAMKHADTTTTICMHILHFMQGIYLYKAWYSLVEQSMLLVATNREKYDSNKEQWEVGIAAFIRVFARKVYLYLTGELFYQAVLLKRFVFMACIFSEIAISDCLKSSNVQEWINRRDTCENHR